MLRAGGVEQQPHHEVILVLVVCVLQPLPGAAFLLEAKAPVERQGPLVTGPDPQLDFIQPLVAPGPVDGMAEHGRANALTRTARVHYDGEGADVAVLLERHGVKQQVLFLLPSLTQFLALNQQHPRSQMVRFPIRNQLS